MKKIYALTMVLFCMSFVHTFAAENKCSYVTNPNPVIENKPVTIEFHAGQSNFNNWEPEVFMYIGVQLNNGDKWQYVPASWDDISNYDSNPAKAGKVKMELYEKKETGGQNKWKKEIPDLYSYFGIIRSPQTIITEIQVVFRSKYSGDNNQSIDYFIPVSEITEEKVMRIEATAPEGYSGDIYISGNFTQDTPKLMSKDAQKYIFTIKESVLHGNNALTYNYFADKEMHVKENQIIRNVTFASGPHADVISDWNDRLMTFRVHVPAGTERVYMNGNFNGWNGEQFMPMEKESEHTWTLSLGKLSLNGQLNFEYKYYWQNDWDSTEEGMEGFGTHSTAFSPESVHEYTVNKWGNGFTVGTEIQNTETLFSYSTERKVLTIHNNPDYVRVDVISVRGERVMIVKNQKEISVKHLPKGIYVLVIDLNGIVSKLKVIN